jgi:hypothetical protein
LETCTREEQRTVAVIRFLGSEGEKPADIHRRMSDYHVFGPLKEAVGGKKFSTDDETKEAMHRWLRSQSEEFFSRGIQALVKRWHTCIERGGDYVEK